MRERKLLIGGGVRGLTMSLLWKQTYVPTKKKTITPRHYFLLVFFIFISVLDSINLTLCQIKFIRKKIISELYKIDYLYHLFYFYFCEF